MAPLGELVLLLAAAGSTGARPPILAVDGRSSSGKTSLARRLVGAVTGSCAVHTDDVAWRHSVFDWAGLLADGVLVPLHLGEPVAFRPPAWERHARPGSLDVPADASLVVVEGVGAGRRELVDLVDAVIWVQSDLEEIERRNLARVATGEISPSSFGRWMAEEVPFIAEQRPWERASLMVNGTPGERHDPSKETVITQRW